MYDPRSEEWGCQEGTLPRELACREQGRGREQVGQEVAARGSERSGWLAW